jgi:hypothetical protein
MIAVLNNLSSGIIASLISLIHSLSQNKIHTMQDIATNPKSPPAAMPLAGLPQST